MRLSRRLILDVKNFDDWLLIGFSGRIEFPGCALMNEYVYTPTYTTLEVTISSLWCKWR